MSLSGYNVVAGIDPTDGSATWQTPVGVAPCEIAAVVFARRDVVVR